MIKWGDLDVDFGREEGCLIYPSLYLSRHGDVNAILVKRWGEEEPGGLRVARRVFNDARHRRS